MKNHDADAALLARYTAAFEKLDYLSHFIVSPALKVGIDIDGWEQWQPRPIATPRSALDALYREMEVSGTLRFPPLYEALVLSYRWTDVDLDGYRLLANEPAEELMPLLAAMRADKHLYTTLVSNGYLPFAKGLDMDYDPVCFDRRHQKSGDCRVVKLDHEAILCHARIREVGELAPDFRSLVVQTIHKADTGN